MKDEVFAYMVGLLRDSKSRWVKERRRAALAINDVWEIVNNCKRKQEGALTVNVMIVVVLLHDVTVPQCPHDWYMPISGYHTIGTRKAYGPVLRWRTGRWCCERSNVSKHRPP